MDNDTAGRKAAEKLSALCKEHGTPYIMAQNDVYGGFKDANDLLLHDKQRLVKTLAGLSERAVISKIFAVFYIQILFCRIIFVCFSVFSCIMMIFLNLSIAFMFIL